MDPTEIIEAANAPDPVAVQDDQPVPATDATAEPAQEAAPVDELSPFDRGLKEAAERGDGKWEDPKSPKPEEAAKPDDTKPEGDDKPSEIEQEIADRKLEGKSADRFRELAGKAKELDELKPLAEQAVARAKEWEDTVASTGATPDQFGRTLGYLAYINSGDPAKMRQAYDALNQELAWLGEQLGVVAPGHNPLAKHPDLLNDIAANAVTIERALEIAEARRLKELHAAQGQRQTEQAQRQQAVQTAAAQVTQLGNDLAASDPHFQAKRPLLEPILELVRDSYPPDQWADRIRAAYLKLPNPTPVAAPVAPARPPVNSPVRPTGVPSSTVTPKVTTANAFDVGLQEAARRGLGGY